MEKKFTQIYEICHRLDQLENLAEWICRETVHQDNAICQTSTLIGVLSDDVKERLIKFISEIENALDTNQWQQ